MKRPSLFFVTPQFGRSGGGVAVSAERIARSLRSEYDLTVVVPERDLVAGTFATEETPGLRLIRFNGGADATFALQFLNDVVEHLAHEHPPAAMLAFYIGDLAYGAAIASGRIGCPLLLFARGNDIDLDIFGERAFKIHFALRSASQVFCVSRELETKVQAFVPGVATQYIPNGVDEALFPFQERYVLGSPITMGLIGEIKHKKGLEFLLAASASVNVHLRIVGSLRPESQKLLQAHFALHPESTERIAHTPFIKDRDALLKIFYELDLVCIPSTHDGMPNVLLEALSCGKVVVASAVGAMRDVLRHRENGYLFTSRDLDSFTRVCEEAIAGLSHADAIRKEARRTVEAEYSWQHERARYLEALRRVPELAH